MRLARLTTLHPNYIRYLHNANHGLAYLGYEQQLREIAGDFYAQADSYTYYLKERGHAAIEIVANCSSLQQMWCREAEIPWDSVDFTRRIALKQLQQFEPEVLFANNFRVFDTDWIEEARRVCKSIKVVIGWCGVGLKDYRPLSGYDCTLTCNRDLARDMRGSGLRVEVVPFGFDTRALSAIDTSGPLRWDVSFAGSLQQSDEFHEDRIRLLETVAAAVRLQVFTDSRVPSKLETCLRQVLFDISALSRRPAVRWMARIPGVRNASRWPERPRMARRVSFIKTASPGVYGKDYLQVLRDSNITLNIHPNCAGAAASNMRLFEATGVGTCLLTDFKDDLSEFFEPDREVVVFRSAAECVEKIQWLLSDPKGRAEIAAAGHARTLKCHTYEKVAERIDAITAGLLAKI